MEISSIMKMKRDGSLYRFHINYKNAKGFVTSTEGFWDQTECPIIDVEKRKITSKRYYPTKQEEREIEIACLMYTEKITRDVVKKTLTVGKIIEKLLLLNENLPICCYPIDKPEKDWWYLECINMLPSDNYDCRCYNIKNFYSGYHTEAFLI